MMLLNVTHGVLIIADTVLNLPEIQAQCVHFQIIIVVSREIHFITYYRRTRLLTGPHEEDGRLWLQELRMKRPLVDILRPAESIRNARSTSQPSTHLVSYTTSNNVKLAILSNSPDQQQYDNPAAAWRRIFKPMDKDNARHISGIEQAHRPTIEQTTSSRKRGLSVGRKNHCSKPKAIR